MGIGGLGIIDISGAQILYKFWYPKRPNTILSVYYLH